MVGYQNLYCVQLFYLVVITYQHKGMITMQVKVKDTENCTLYSAMSFHTYVFSCILHAEYLNSVQAIFMWSFPDCDEGISPDDCNTDFWDKHFQLQFCEIYFCVEPVILKVVLELSLVVNVLSSLSIVGHTTHAESVFMTHFSKWISVLVMVMWHGSECMEYYVGGFWLWLEIQLLSSHSFVVG